MIGYASAMDIVDTPIVSANAGASPPTITVGQAGDRQVIATTAAMCERARELLATRGHATAKVRYPLGGEREIVTVE